MHIPSIIQEIYIEKNVNYDQILCQTYLMSDRLAVTWTLKSARAFSRIFVNFVSWFHAYTRYKPQPGSTVQEDR